MKIIRANGWIYRYNEKMTSIWAWPEGFKGQRVRIKKSDLQQVLKEKEVRK